MTAWLPTRSPGAARASAWSRRPRADRRALLYARVDGVEREGDFVLMKLEINEPHRFLSLSAEAARIFADEIVRVLREPLPQGI